jgi:hypothetical protein
VGVVVLALVLVQELAVVPGRASAQAQGQVRVMAPRQLAPMNRRRRRTP